MKCDKEKGEEGKVIKGGREGGWQRWEEEESHILPWIYSLVIHILPFSCAPLSFHSLDSFLHAFLVPVLRLDRFTLASCYRPLNDNVITHTSNSPDNPESRILRRVYFITSAISLRNDAVCRMEFTRFQKFRTTWIFSLLLVVVSVSVLIDQSVPQLNLDLLLLENLNLHSTLRGSLRK